LRNFIFLGCLLVLSVLGISCGGSSPSGANNNSGASTSNYYFKATGGSAGVSAVLSWAFSEVPGNPYSGTVTTTLPYTSPNCAVVSASGSDFSVAGAMSCFPCSVPLTLTIYNSSSVAVTQAATTGVGAMTNAVYIEP
jgi:hypothetical protein